MDRINRGIQAHSAPLGLKFFQNTSAPELYREGAAVGLHGSWNRTQKTGYKVVFFPWDALTQLPGDQVDLVTGWADAFSSWGRPVDVAVDPAGAILISDDQASAIYKLTYSTTPPPPPPPTQSVASFTLINADTDQPIAGYESIAERREPESRDASHAQSEHPREHHAGVGGQRSVRARMGMQTSEPTTRRRMPSAATTERTTCRGLRPWRTIRSPRRRSPVLMRPERPARHARSPSR